MVRDVLKYICVLLLINIPLEVEATTYSRDHSTKHDSAEFLLTAEVLGYIPLLQINPDSIKTLELNESFSSNSTEYIRNLSNAVEQRSFGLIIKVKSFDYLPKNIEDTLVIIPTTSMDPFRPYPGHVFHRGYLENEYPIHSEILVFGKQESDSSTIQINDTHGPPLFPVERRKLSYPTLVPTSWWGTMAVGANSKEFWKKEYNHKVDLYKLSQNPSVLETLQIFRRMKSNGVYWKKRIEIVEYYVNSPMLRVILMGKTKLTK